MVTTEKYLKVEPKHLGMEALCTYYRISNLTTEKIMRRL